MITAHRIALDPTCKQDLYFRRACGVSRFAYNWALAEWRKQYESGLKPSALKLKQQWNTVRKIEYPWSYEVTKCASNQAVLDVGTAFQNFFRSLKSGKKAGYPKFKVRGRCRDSFALWNDQFRVEDSSVRIPGLGFVRMHEPLRFEGKILGAVVSRTADRWFISIQVEVSDQVAVQHPQESVGIDLGIKQLATLSHPLADGTQVFENPKPLRAATVKLRRIQRGCSRQEQVRKKSSAKKSKRAQKRQRQLARVHSRVANIRADILHKMTTRIASEFKVVVLEDLNNAGLVLNHKLARSLSDASFGEIRRQLEYKTTRAGGRVVAIHRFERSTGVCPDCGYKTTERLPLRVRSWTCPSCSTSWDRDIAAAKVIHKVGTACPEPAGPLDLLTHGESLALVAAKAATKPSSANRELHREHLCSQR